MKNKKVVNPSFAKSEEYHQVLEEILDQGDCPFCPEHFRHHAEEILKESGDWFVTKNSWPYDDAKHHFLFICKSHKEQFSDLSMEDFAAVQELANWVIKKFQIKGGGLTMRFGEANLSGATVSHLHFHLISPEVNIETGAGKTVNFPIG